MEFFTALLALLLISLALVEKFDFNAALAPLVSFAVSILLIDIFGVFGALSAGFAAFYLLAAASLVLVAVGKPNLKNLAKKFFKPGMVFFIAASLFFYFALYYTGPDFRYWDEYSFWGIAAKTMWMEDSLHTMVDTSMTLSAYLPGLPTTGVFFQYFSPVFREWKVYLGYDVLMMAMMSCIFAANRWKNVGANIACAVFGVLGAYGFIHGFNGFLIYTTAYADMPLGVSFGAVFLCWFVPRRKGLQEYIAAMMALVLMTLIKDMGLALGLVAAGIISMDIWLSGSYPLMKNAKGRLAKTARAALVLVLLMASVAVIYKGWLTHFTAVTDIVSSDIGYEYSALEIFTGKDPYFIFILNAMWEALGVQQIISFGPMVTMIVAFTALPIIGGIVSRKGKKALRAGTAGLLLMAGFFVFYIFHAYIYTAVFAHEYSLTSYDRYMSSYALGWLMAVMGIAISDLCDIGIKGAERLFGTLSILVYMVLVFWLNPYHPDQYIFTSKKLHSQLQKWELATSYEKDYLEYGDLLTTEDRFYFYCAESDGGEWFVFNYEFLPAYTVPSFGTGNFVGEISEDSGRYDVVATKENVREYFLEQEVDYFYIMRSNDYFRQEFGELFTDRLESFYDGSTKLYKVGDDGENLTFTPIYTREGFIYLNETQG